VRTFRTFLLTFLVTILLGCQLPFPNNPQPLDPDPLTVGRTPAVSMEPSAGVPQPGDPSPPPDSGAAIPQPESGIGETESQATPPRPGIFLPHIERNPDPTLTPSPTSAPTPQIPGGANILIIMSDDQRYDTMAYMPRTQALIFDQGITFNRAFITTPSCCPSRASVLTGLYAYNHEVFENQDPLEKRTFMEDFQAAGYFTGVVGKYLNSWDGTMRPEYDFWVSFEGGSSPYFDPRLNVQGEWVDHSGYMTYILGDYAEEFLDQALQQEAPFVLLFTPNAPHEPSDPAPGDESLYPDLPLYRPPNFNEPDVSDKPAWVAEYEPFTDERIAEIDRLRLRMIQTLNALDQEVEGLITRLEEAGELDNTFVIYMSDNGYYWGEHRRRRGKGYAWEEGVRVPMAIRYPPLVRAGQEDDHLVSNIDLAPTFYQLAGLEAPEEMDGTSLIPLLVGDAPWRDRLVIENWVRFGPYVAVRTEHYLYVEWESDETELYDMEEDPYQLENQVGNPAYAGVVDELRRFLNQNRGD
jgi:N-acetylglucosamine-6-sulfatase